MCAVDGDGGVDAVLVSSCLDSANDTFMFCWSRDDYRGIRVEFGDLCDEALIRGRVAICEIFDLICCLAARFCKN